MMKATTFLSRLVRRVRARARCEQGFIFTTIIMTLGYGAVAIGLVGTGVAVANKVTISDSTSEMRQQAQDIQQRLQGNDSKKAQVLKQNAQIMQQVADRMDSDANWELGTSVTANVLDAATAGITSKSKAGYQAVKIVLDGYTGWQLGQSAFDAVDPPKPETDAAIKMLQDAPRYQPGDTTGATPDFGSGSNVDGYIFQTQANVMNGEVSALYPEADPALVADLAQQLVIDYTLDQMSAPASAATPAGGNPFLADGVPSITSKVDPNQTVDVAMGQIALSPEDQAALGSGDKDSVVGVYFGQNGLEPVVVTNDPDSGLQTEFTLLPEQPVVDTGDDYKPVVEDMPTWWDGTVDSCPYLYVWDGERFSPVNDIISVSRDPEREYDDFMMFAATPSADGAYDVRIVEVRNEESWLDLVGFSAVDVPDGMGAAVSPGGDAYSIGAVRTPDPISAISPMALDRADRAIGLIDGRGLRLYDGPGPEAVFSGVGGDAVLLITMDGFENNGAPGAPLFKRPAVHVEAWNGSAWIAAGTVHPRERTDTTALDVSRFVVDQQVRVRLSSDSCNVGTFQLLDRLALSTADRSLVRVTPLAIDSALLGTTDVRSTLAAADGVRIHTVPGDSIDILFAAGDPDCFIVESRGWYRPLE